ncbi:MAG: asparagine synthase (glutamine-hydrolyzing) [Bacteroidales bacterium]|nr:asparagine synthase (glutamine-hydrolyzing) [Bacteroidales bacterium]
MCGISGIIVFNESDRKYLDKINVSVKTIKKRGTDNSEIFKHNNVALGHTRLAVIDTSEAANQPLTDVSGRYTIVFNGEFYNYREHREKLLKQGVSFKSKSDSEVLLNLFIKEGISCLEKVNGFFAFAIYDKINETLFIARDRIGIKPLLIYKDENKFIFASEMKAILSYGIHKDIDKVSLLNYFQLSYIPGTQSIFKDVSKLTPGTFIKIEKGKIKYQSYYKIPHPKISISDISYEDAKRKLFDMLDKSVSLRLVSDVPLGAFLSGGIDSSVIVALAARHTNNLNTFSIGYKDEPFFDETKYAELVAKKYNTNHTVFRLSNDDLFENLFDVLDYIDEPFGDSSALPVYILSKYTRQKVTVALSGDGADEMFAGYNKHLAHYLAKKKSLINSSIKAGLLLWEILPKSRNNKLFNRIRQIYKYSEGLKINEKERYWRWCSYINEKEAKKLLITKYNEKDYHKRKKLILNEIDNNSGLSELLYTDMHLVLQNDMLTKVDSMSMANNLEVRTPFLDHNLVDFVFSLPDDFKINNSFRKRILQDTFKEYLPNELYNRPKQGFEVPLLKWLKNELKSMITDDLLNDDFIISQNIFNIDQIRMLKKQLFSNNPTEVQSQIWNLIVFQYWWKKYFI